MAETSIASLLSRVLGAPTVVTTRHHLVAEIAIFNLRGKDTYVAITNGLSDVPLSQASHPRVRQELIITANKTVQRDVVVALLLSVADEIVQRGTAVLRGEVFGPAGPLVPDSRLTALFATSPVFLPPTFTQDSCEGEPRFAVWLVPISSEEAVKASALAADFEDQLESIAATENIYSFFR